MPDPEGGADAPAWFTEALAAPSDGGEVEVLGCSIRYRRWGDPADPAVVLVHGGGAHLQWWTYLAPLLARGRCVAALDLSGHGDSGWRDAYPEASWVEEIFAVAAAAGLRPRDPRPTLIGHSMGGLIAMHLVAARGEELDGAIIIDAPVQRPGETWWVRGGNPFINMRSYPDRETALARFRLVPHQPCDNAWLVRHVALHSVREGDDGWTWKFDPEIFRTNRVPHGDLLEASRCRVAILHGEHSRIVSAERAAYIAGLPPGETPLTRIDGAHHHVLLDRPLALVDALVAQLDAWASTRPHGGPARRSV